MHLIIISNNFLIMQMMKYLNAAPKNKFELKNLKNILNLIIMQLFYSSIIEKTVNIQIRRK